MRWMGATSWGSALLVLAVIGMPQSASANCRSDGGTRCSSVLIDGLSIEADGVYVGTDSDESPLNSGDAPCVPLSGVYLVLSLAHPNYQAMFSTLLAAKLAGREVNMRVLADPARAGTCTIAYVYLH